MESVTVLPRPASGAPSSVAPTIGIDGVIVRGRARARITIGEPLLRIDGDRSREVRVSRRSSTLTFVCPPQRDGRAPLIIVRVPHLRGVATSGDVDLTVDDRSDRPIFLDLAGAGRARIRGAVPLARTTTSGTVTADFSALRAPDVRVHARERSRTLFDAYGHLTIVAVDDASVRYRGANPDRVTLRNRASAYRTRR